MRRVSAFTTTVADLISSGETTLLGPGRPTRTHRRYSRYRQTTAADSTRTPSGSDSPSAGTTAIPHASTSLSTGSTLSTDGSVLLAGSSGSLITSAGTWKFNTTTNAYGSLILLNGASAAGGSATELEVANKGQLYARNAQGK